MAIKKPFTIYALISLIIMALLIVPGYIHSFDMSWGPEYPLHLSSSNSFILSFIIKFLISIFPSFLIQKLILFLIFLISGLGAHKLAAFRSNTFAYFAGVLYVFNPFVYTRFIAGQWLVLLGYALLPWAIRYFYQFLENPTFKRTILVILSTTLICLTSIHTVGILFLVYLLLFIGTKKGNIKQISIKLLVIALSLLVINSFWLLPLLQGKSNINENIQYFGETQTSAFATRGTIAESPVISASLLTGFWADNQERYMLPSEQPIWWIGAIGVITLVAIGVIVVLKRKDRLGLILTVSGIISLILGIGAASGLTAQITATLSHILPIYSGYREPHKWLMILAVAYSFLGSIGAYRLLEYIKSRYGEQNYIPKITLLLIHFLFAPTLAFGAAGQLKSIDYPQDWYDVKYFLESDMEDRNILADEFDIVVFPWHQYLPISFTGRVIANPSKYFFRGNLLVSGDPELKGVNAIDNNEISKYIREEILPFEENQLLINEKLKEKSVEYILLLKESDWKRYSWLSESMLKNILENDSLILYKVN